MTGFSGEAIQGQGRCLAGIMRPLVTFCPEMRNVLAGWQSMLSSKDNAASRSKYFKHAGFCPVLFIIYHLANTASLEF